MPWKKSALQRFKAKPHGFNYIIHCVMKPKQAKSSEKTMENIVSTAVDTSLTVIMLHAMVSSRSFGSFFVPWELSK